GPTSDTLKNQILNIMEGKANEETTEAAAVVETNNGAAIPDKATISLTAPLSGDVVSLEEVPDDVFSQKMMGDGVAIKPSEGKVVSPADGEIVSVFPAKHAVALRTDDGAELLIHMGLDTVNLNGEPFDIKVSAQNKIKKGAPLAQMNIDLLKEKGYNTITPIIITNGDQFKVNHETRQSSVTAGEDALVDIYTE